MRDELWKLALEKRREGNVLQVWSDRCPQGYKHRSIGDDQRELIDVEGIALVRRRRREGSKTGVPAEAPEQPASGS